LVIVHDPPEVRCGAEPLHHLIQGRKRKANCFLWHRRNGGQWGCAGREPVFSDLVAETWVSRIFYGALDIGGRNLPSENRDQAPIEGVMRQYHIFVCGVVLCFLPFS
jgi:hypothetical protein